MWFLLGCGTPEPVSSTPVVVEVEEVIEPLQVTCA